MENQFKSQFYKDKTSEIKFPYFQANFNGKTFIAPQDNFKKQAHIPSSLIFTQESLCDDTPLFTIAIPTYKRIDTLKEALDSALNQDISKYPMGGGQTDSINTQNPNISSLPYEIIVVENCDDFNTTSKTQIFLESRYKNKVTYYKNNENLGLFGNWNRCITLAKGKWVCLLHDDDILFSHYLKDMYKAVKMLKNIALISSDAELFGENLANDPNYRDVIKMQKFNQTLRGKIKSLLKNIIFHNIVQTFEFTDETCHFLPATRPAALLHNKELFIKAGGYNQEFFPMDDIYGALRTARMVGIAHYKVTTNAKRVDICQGAMRDLSLEYSLQHYYFIKDCLNYNDIYKRYLLHMVLEWPINKPKDKDNADRFYKKYNINVDFSIFDKIVILITKTKFRILRALRNSRWFFAYDKYLN